MVVCGCGDVYVVWVDVVCGCGVADEDEDADVDVSFCGPLTHPAINNTAITAAMMATKSVRFIFISLFWIGVHSVH